MNIPASGAETIRGRWALGGGLALAAAWAALQGQSDPDVWWHLASGRFIVETGAIPRTDPFSYVIAGQPWVCFEWLFDVVLYGAYAAGGFWGVAVLKAAVVIGAALALFAAGGAGGWAAVWTAAALIVSRDSLVARPQLADFLGISILLLALRDRRSPGMMWAWFPALEALWANLHGGAALLGAALVGLRAGAALVAGGPRPVDSALRWGGLALAGTAGVCLNPWGWDLFGHLDQALAFPGLRLIAEWAPPATWLAPSGFFLAAAAGAAVLGGRRTIHLALAAALFAAMAAGAARHMPLFMLSAAALCSAAAQARWAWGAPRGAGSALLALGVLAAGAAHQGGWGAPAANLLDPMAGAAAFLRAEGITGRMFNSYGAGGPLIWHGTPENGVFVDGRMIEYGPAHIADAAGWHRPEVWARLEDRWDFDFAVVENTRGLHTRVLDDSKTWALVYWDDGALVYVKTRARFKTLAQKLRYRELRPGEASFGALAAGLRDPSRAARVMAEIDRSLGPLHNSIAHGMKAFALMEVGRREEAWGHLESAAAGAARDPGPWFSFGWYHEKGREWPQARRAYARALTLASRRGETMTAAFAHNNLGAVESRMGRREQALRHFREALRLFPGHAQALRNLRSLQGGRR